MTPQELNDLCERCGCHAIIDGDTRTAELFGDKGFLYLVELV